MSKALAVGDQAPELAIPDQQGKKVTLDSFKGKQVVLYFYPKDDTPGCTKESCDFRDVESQILRAGGTIVGVSLDGKESHQKFIKKFGLPFPLLSDESAAISKAYGVYKEKNMYGKKYWGIERSTFVIDPEGKVKAIFGRSQVDGHADEVLKALKASRKTDLAVWSPARVPTICRVLSLGVFFSLALTSAVLDAADKPVSQSL
ncbi:MAG: thioredoxin-dependent thiol peroxidase [Nitrospira sp.]|nr:thioredoxin-dependent thiol peroxidase [Nitrospira sp.]